MVPIGRVSTPTVFLVSLLFAFVPGQSSATPSVVFNKVKSAGVWMNLVTVNLNDPSISVTPAVSRWGIGSCESFRSMMRRTRPAAAIDGTFFCTRTYRPTGDIVIDGRLVWKGYLGVALGIRGNRFISFLPSRRRDLYNWCEFDDVLAAGPTLIAGGTTRVSPKSEGFHSRVHYTRRVRSAVGLTYANKLLLATTTRPVYLSQLAVALKTLKCVDAAVLDGGSSTGLYYKGKLIRNPSRAMTNCLLVYDDPFAFDRNRNAFCPGWSDYSSQYSREPMSAAQPVILQL